MSEFRHQAVLKLDDLDNIVLKDSLPEAARQKPGGSFLSLQVAAAVASDLQQEGRRRIAAINKQVMMRRGSLPQASAVTVFPHLQGR